MEADGDEGLGLWGLGDRPPLPPARAAHVQLALNLAEIQRLLGVPSLDEQLVGQGPVLRPIAVGVASYAPSSPVLVKGNLDSWGSTNQGTVSPWMGGAGDFSPLPILAGVSPCLSPCSQLR